MSDIYKNQQQMPVAATKPKRRRRRSSSSTTFDDTGKRRRRSGNAGVRRFLHLFRKPANEKKIWWSTLIVIVVALTIIAIWQFLYLEHVARERSKKSELYVPLSNQPQTDSAAE